MGSFEHICKDFCPGYAKLRSVVLLTLLFFGPVRTFGSDAVSPKVVEDRDYLEKVKTEFRSDGIPAEEKLA